MLSLATLRQFISAISQACRTPERESVRESVWERDITDKKQGINNENLQKKA